MHYRELVLHHLALQIEDAWPGVVVGWDLGLAAGPPEEGGTVLEAFSVEEPDEWDFLRATRPLIKRAGALLGAPVMLVPHDSSATRGLYPDVPERIRALRRHH